MRMRNVAGLWATIHAAIWINGMVDRCAAQTCAIVENQRLIQANPEQNPWFGRMMAGSGDWAIVGVPDHQPSSGYRPGAAYLLHRANDNWAIERQLLAPDASHGDQFGWTVAIDGNWAAVGAPGDDHSNLSNAGSVHVYWFSGLDWIHHSTLTGNGIPPAPGSGELFGDAVAISSTTMLIGAPFDSTAGFIRGSVYVFEFDGSKWVQRQRLYAPDADQYQRFGRMIAIDRDAAVISRNHAWGGSSAPPNVYVFRRDSSLWQFEQMLTADNLTTLSFGSSLAIDGDHIVVGAPNQDNGAAYAYRFDGQAWTAPQHITVPEICCGDITFGSSLALRGNELFIGAPWREAYYIFPTYQTGFYDNAGRVYRFNFDGLQWQHDLTMQPAFYDGPHLPEPINVQMGWGLALADETLLAGAPFDNQAQPMVLAFEFSDCNEDGTINACDPDCNMTAVSDLCEILTGASGDCNVNSVPDECEGGLVYANEGGADGLLYGPVHGGGDMIWVNPFTVQPGGEYITHIALFWSSVTLDGLQGAIMLYRDPDNDGNPNNAVYLASKPISSHGTFGNTTQVPLTIESIERTFVGNVGDTFFVGAMMSVPGGGVVAAGGSPAFGPTSWHWVTPVGQANILDLSANPLAQSINIRYVLRALSLDCNGNGIWDQCDIDSGTSLDLNANSIPDECEQQPCAADIDDDGEVAVSDLLAVISAWGSGPGSPADITNDGIVDVADLLAVINSWGPCP